MFAALTDPAVDPDTKKRISKALEEDQRNQPLIGALLGGGTGALAGGSAGAFLHLDAEAKRAAGAATTPLLEGGKKSLLTKLSQNPGVRGGLRGAGIGGLAGVGLGAGYGLMLKEREDSKDNKGDPLIVPGMLAGGALGTLGGGLGGYLRGGAGVAAGIDVAAEFLKEEGRKYAKAMGMPPEEIERRIKERFKDTKKAAKTAKIKGLGKGALLGGLGGALVGGGLMRILGPSEDANYRDPLA